MCNRKFTYFCHTEQHVGSQVLDRMGTHISRGKIKNLPPTARKSKNFHFNLFKVVVNFHSPLYSHTTLAISKPFHLPKPRTLYPFNLTPVSLLQPLIITITFLFCSLSLYHYLKQSKSVFFLLLIDLFAQHSVFRVHLCLQHV